MTTENQRALDQALALYAQHMDSAAAAVTASGTGQCCSGSTRFPPAQPLHPSLAVLMIHGHVDRVAQACP